MKMIKIIARSELSGAEKFGSCASCGSGSDGKKIFKLEFEDIYSNRTSISLCCECMKKLKNMITK